MNARKSPPPSVLSVSQLTQQIKGTLENTFPSVWVAGELSDLARPRSGHIYFTLKDGHSQIRGVIWRSLAQRLRFQLEDGLMVVCQGAVEVYAPRGSYQLIARKVEPQGMGALQLALQQLQQRLAAEGLFAPEHKRPLPRFPRRIGLVTSLTGAAVRDFLEAARRRWPSVQILVIPAVVQGKAAPRSIVEGIIAANAVTPALDVLVVGRGGGSMEDLWCFNDELVVRALVASTVPTVSAVGHEIDVTLADLAADVRALTPSHAAELVIPDAVALTESLRQLRTRLRNRMQYQLENCRRRLDTLGGRPVLQRPLERVHDASRRLDELDARGRRAMQVRLEKARGQWEQASAALASLSPLATLQRGYSITLDAEDGGVIHDSRQLEPGQRIHTRLARGTVESEVRATRNVSPSTSEEAE
jgi:exodeoxyribonuclease VII large subunit